MLTVKSRMINIYFSCIKESSLWISKINIKLSKKKNPPAGGLKKRKTIMG